MAIFPMPSPSRIQIPSPNIYYRIQSVSLVSYLDLHDVDDSNVFLRPLHDDHEQKWLFVPSAGGFKVMNAATERLRNKRYLNIDLQGRTTAYASTDKDSPHPVIWDVTQDQEEGIFSFTCDAGDGKDAFLSINPESGRTSFEIKEFSNANILSRDMKWRILEVTPSIPKDFYQIRAWFGRVLHMTTESRAVSLVPLNENKNEEWEVEPLGNGRCTIKSFAAGSYLGWETRNDGITKVLKTNLPKEWIVKYVSLNGYTITTSDQPLYGERDLALTNHDTSQLYMKPIKVTQNQIWFFESVNVSMDAYADGLDPYPLPGTIVRYDDVTEKVWVIYNAQDLASDQAPRYITYFTFSSTYTPLGLYSKHTTQNQFTLKYTSTSGGEFHLTTSNARPHVVRADNEVRIEPQNPSGWVLERAVGPDASRFYYFICASDDHNQVLSGEPKKYNDGGEAYDLLTMTTKKTANTPPTQLWWFSS